MLPSIAYRGILMRLKETYEFDVFEMILKFYVVWFNVYEIK